MVKTSLNLPENAGSIPAAYRWEVSPNESIRNWAVPSLLSSVTTVVIEVGAAIEACQSIKGERFNIYDN
ncbi:MAG: hypothetical protein II399_04395, partial [Lachnospiraceae bacterium]|nr:hypothetical protein [Lachnospiraceae bacterium]